ncbi:MAG: hypothetical protein H6Q25_962 [Bacteroidetes bacterium]|nr:hypothetical protein [Bacteroidota bacterium]
MKKFYTTLMLVLIASLSFAQISTQTVKEGKNQFPIQKRTLNNVSKAGAGSWWFSYAEDLGIYLGETLEDGGSTFLQDSVATINYNDGTDGRPQFYSFAQVFDFTEDIWYEMYNGVLDDEGNPIHVPHIGGTPTYSIDSIGCLYAYFRESSIAANIVDTLVMTVVANPSFSYIGVTYDGTTTAFKQADIAYNKIDATIAPSTYAKFYQVKIPLTVDDTTGNSYIYRLLPVTGFNNISQKSVAVAFSFKSGTPNRTLASIVGTDISRFIGYYTEDPRSEYNTEGSTALVNEKSTSLNAMEYSVASPSFFLYGKYIHNKVWNGNLRRPGILLHATCDDCQWVGVNEADQKNITVRPNPATDNFTVTLAENTPANVQLFNIVGQMVYNQKTTEESLTVNVNNLTSGIYMLKVTQNGRTYTSKVVVK